MKKTNFMKPSSQWPHQNSINFWEPCIILVYMATKQNKLYHSSSPKLAGWFSNNFCRNVSGVTLYQIPSIHVDWSKNMTDRGLGFLALYGYSGNLNNKAMMALDCSPELCNAISNAKYIRTIILTKIQNATSRVLTRFSFIWPSDLFL